MYGRIQPEESGSVQSELGHGVGGEAREEEKRERRGAEDQEACSESARSLEKEKNQGRVWPKRLAYVRRDGKGRPASGLQSFRQRVWSEVLGGAKVLSETCLGFLWDLTF